MQAATAWISRISDFRSSQHGNPNNLDCLNPKKVWHNIMERNPNHPCPASKVQMADPSQIKLYSCGTL